MKKATLFKLIVLIVLIMVIKFIPLLRVEGSGIVSLNNCTPDSIIGDVNGDGKVNTADALLINKITLGLARVPENKCCIDVNNDKTINNSDVSMVNNYYISGGLNTNSGLVGKTCSAVMSWENVGISDFTGGLESDRYSLAVDSGGFPYIAYSDPKNSNKVTVMKWDGISWVNVGNPGFSVTTAFLPNLVLDSHDVPYVVYGNRVNTALTIMKFNGTSWVNVGNPIYSDYDEFYPKIDLDSHNIPYVVYLDSANNSKTTVIKFNGTSWVNVGNPGFSLSVAVYPDIILDSNNIPYIYYTDNKNMLTVMKFNGTSWVNVGDPKLTEYGGENFLAFDSNNIPYVVTSVMDHHYMLTVIKFNGTSWVNVGNPSFSKTGVTAINPSIVLDSNNVPYVVYSNFGNNFRATVMRYK